MGLKKSRKKTELPVDFAPKYRKTNALGVGLKFARSTQNITGINSQHRLMRLIAPIAEKKD